MTRHLLFVCWSGASVCMMRPHTDAYLSGSHLRLHAHGRSRRGCSLARRSLGRCDGRGGADPMNYFIWCARLKTRSILMTCGSDERREIASCKHRRISSEGSQSHQRKP